MRCTATATSRKGQCAKSSIIGSNVCWKHGGAAPQVIRAGLRRMHSLSLYLDAEALLHPSMEALEAAAKVREQIRRKLAVLVQKKSQPLAIINRRAIHLS